MAFMFGSGRQSETAGCSSGLVRAAGSRAKTLDWVTRRPWSRRAGLSEQQSGKLHLSVTVTHLCSVLSWRSWCVCVGVGEHAAVSGGAAACSLCLQLLWQCFAPQAAEVNTIMALALPARPRGPAGWTHTGSSRVDAGRHSWKHTFL